MRVVWLALDAFLPGILGESIALNGDSTTVVAYLKKQGEYSFQVDVEFGTRDHGLDKTVHSDLIHKIHSGKGEHLGRPVELSRSGPSHWVVSPSLGVSCHLQGVRSSSWRLVCYQSKHETCCFLLVALDKKMCVSSTRSSDMEAKWLSISLEQSHCPLISPFTFLRRLVESDA